MMTAAIGGCVDEADAGSNAPGPEIKWVEAAAKTKLPEGTIYGRLMHSIALSETHEVMFFDMQPGYLVHEKLHVDYDAPLVHIEDGSTLAGIYRAVTQGVGEQPIPDDIVRADEEIARFRERARDHEPELTSESEDDLVLPPEAALQDANESNVGVVSQAILACLGDLQNDQWGADWFQNAHCGGGSERFCRSNQRTFESGSKFAFHFVSSHMEGAYPVTGADNRGTSRATADECFAVDCSEDFFRAVLWDMELAERQLFTDGFFETTDFTRRFRSTSFSPCNHGHGAARWVR